MTRLSAVYAKGGKQGFLRQSIEMHKRERDATIFLARDYANLGEKDLAYQELELAFKSRDELLLWVLIDPECDSLRSEPRFVNLLRQIDPSRT